MRTALAAALAAFVLALPAARADIPPRPRPNPPPRPQPVRPIAPPPEVKFTVEVDDKAKGPKLVVPQNLTGVRLQPRPAAPAGKDPVAYLEFEGDDAAPAGDQRNPNHLMIAGVALTLALGLGGIWLVRRPGRGVTRGLVLLLVAGGTLAVSTAVWANAAPPPPPAPKTEKVVLPIAFDGNVTLEVTAAGDTIRLVLDKDTFEKMKKDPKAPGEK